MRLHTLQHISRSTSAGRKSMQLEEKTPQKRPLSFSDDSYEWDSIRDDVPADMGWNSMKRGTIRHDEDSSLLVSPNDFSIEWVPSGHRSGGRRSIKRRKLDPNVTIPVQKPKSEHTCEFLEEGDREVARNIIDSISTSAGTFEFERATNDSYARLLPFPTGISDEKIVRGDWQLDHSQCKLESLLSGSPSKICRDVSFPPWKAAQRKERKYEVLHVDRSARMEDISVEEGEFSWSTLESIIKHRFINMDPTGRYSIAKRISEMLDERPASANTSG
ncbi:hypothetical protein NECAME_07307 [Necator americanus]|uniref:Uncharacterized protein n=1 Tax=Necator americanus TaxID=51031 RepID=W2TNH0_NECAM|nr:hypothetical protein NECAME_07307 [Necator americanus]ETN83650.1 hypothetical protein NECAME_07307 [Necator americanus]